VRHFKESALGDPAMTGEFEERLRKVRGKGGRGQIPAIAA
jgi:hypothetical protein